MEEEKKEVVELEVKLPAKSKKPRTEKQVAAQQKALSILKQRREAKAKEEKEIKESREIAKDKWREVKKKTPVDDIVTKKDLEAFMNNIRSMIPGEKVVEKVVEKPIERVVEKVIEKPIPTVKKISGHELLDSLFFNK